MQQLQDNTRPIIFLGSSDTISIFADVCWDQSIPIAGIIDSDYYGNTDSIDGISYIGNEHTADFDELKKTHDFFIGVNPIPGIERNIRKRQMFIDLIKEHDLPCANLIERQSRVGKLTTLGKGVFIGYCASIHSHVTIGDFCQVYALSAVAHHSVLGENVVVQRMVMVTSHSTVGNNAYIGMCSKLLKSPTMTIGENSFIHPGITVMRDVEPNEIVSLTGRNSRKIYDTVVV